MFAKTDKIKRLSQNRVEMASFVLFQIEVIWIFHQKIGIRRKEKQSST